MKWETAESKRNKAMVCVFWFVVVILCIRLLHTFSCRGMHLTTACICVCQGNLSCRTSDTNKYVRMSSAYLVAFAAMCFRFVGSLQIITLSLATTPSRWDTWEQGSMHCIIYCLVCPFLLSFHNRWIANLPEKKSSCKTGRSGWSSCVHDSSH